MDENKVNAPEEEVKEDTVAEAEPQPETETPASEKKQKKKKSREAEELEKLRQEVSEQQERYLRLMAEYDNYRKRTQKERESIYPDAVANTLKELLPLFDNFQRAMETPCADENYAKGIEMIEKSLEDFLGKMGVEAFGKAGEPFDPNLHNAVMHLEDETLGKNVIATVFQSGYRMGDRILRHAMVQQAN